MTQENQRIAQLIRAVVSAYVDHPEAVRLACQESPGFCYWAMQGDARDEAQLIGRGGAHVDALALLVMGFGKAVGEVHTFRLITTGNPRTRDRRDKDVLAYDPEPDRLLLMRVVDALGLSPAPDVRWTNGDGPRVSLTYVLRLLLPPKALARLSVPPREQPNPKKAPISYMRAIEDIFQAIAAKAGVRYELEEVEV